MELQEAILAWDNAASEYDGRIPPLADSCRATARSLRLELQTGVPHCTCHFVPTSDCSKEQYIKKQRRYLIEG